MNNKFEIFSLNFLRFSIAASFLSAVADRFGLWGLPGSPHVSWGNFDNFMAYTASLNWFLPKAIIPTLAWLATILEVALAILLIVGFKLKEAAFSSGVLLCLFFITMVLSSGFKGPLNYSVFTAAAASFLLSSFYKKSQSEGII